MWCWKSSMCKAVQWRPGSHGCDVFFDTAQATVDAVENNDYIIYLPDKKHCRSAPATAAGM